MPILTLLTDFGSRDYYVGAIKGTVLRLAPGALIVDLSHEIEPGNVAGATFVWGAAAPTFPAGTIHLAVVDPGVGSGRRMLAVERGGSLFLAPDNGLATPFLDGAAVFSIARPDLYMPSPGATFHGRDRFAPCAAFLLRGGQASELGPRIEDPARLPGDPPRRTGGRLWGRILHIDRYGNLVTDLPAAWLTGALIEAQTGENGVTRLVGCYAELATGEAGLMAGSLGTLELAANRRPLAELLGAGIGDPVEVRFREEERGGPG